MTEDLLENHRNIAPVKKEYILKTVKRDESTPTKERGQNKKRPRTHVNDTVKLCSNAAIGVQCTREACKYEHDVEHYLLHKEQDLGDECPLFNIMGKCPYGFKCRFSQSHMKDGKLVVEEQKFSNYKSPISNAWSFKLQESIRKGVIDTKASDEYIKKYREMKKVREVEQKHEEKREERIEKDEEKQTKETEVNQPNDEVAKIKDEGKQTLDEDIPDFHENYIKPTARERKRISFKDKLYLAPLTTVGNLPFRRICKLYGADITCGEMALSSSLLTAQPSDWALLKRHESEDIFGVQICGNKVETMTRCAEILSKTTVVDFIDINMGCPIDQVYNKGMGSGLLDKTNKIYDIISGINSVTDVPITVKVRTGIVDGKNIVHDKLVPLFKSLNVNAITIHGRSRQQRYSREADWNYIRQCAAVAVPEMDVIGNGDIFSYEDYNRQMESTNLSTVMIARGALVKPWIFTEIKEQRHWDISSRERFEILQKYANFGLEHFGSDTEGVNKTRRFLLEWISFLHRYIPVGLMEVLPQKITQRPPKFFGRDELETLMASDHVDDWIELTNRILGKTPDSFQFIPKHKANAY